MQYRDPLPERDLEATGRLRSQRNLGNQNDRAAAVSDDSPDRLDVHVRLPASGDAVEQCLVETAAIQGASDQLQRRGLMRGRRPGFRRDFGIAYRRRHDFAFD